HKRVYIHTDNTSVIARLNRYCLKSSANIILKEAHLLACFLDIELVPKLIAGMENGLSDALSRFDHMLTANYCFQLQSL
ncbi:hypothetical protein BJ878DRAFT_389369, partial [Calycina marina]